jgi:hypothetical protein
MTDDKKQKILNEEDYINCPKYRNSIKHTINKFPDGIDSHLIAKYLMISEEEVEENYKDAIEKLKKMVLK